MKNYDHLKLEKKWQKEWEKINAYKTGPEKGKKAYILDMFPYPSGAGLHVGHPRGYIGSDVYSRMKRMQGFNILHPMGYDAFGLPAEQYALEHKIHPSKAVEKNIKTFEKQLKMIGLAYDWDRKVNTTDPKYYKWTQWIFLKLYNSWYDNKQKKARDIKELVEIFRKEGNKNINAASGQDVVSFSAKDWIAFSVKEKQEILMKYRLAFEGYSEVNWCSYLGTVLANDEVLTDDKGNLVSERGNHPVEKKSMRQWFLRITAYADRLLENLEDLEWSDHIKEIQKNWIGRSEGSLIDFKIQTVGKFSSGSQTRKGEMSDCSGNFSNNSHTIKVFTTRADTLFGVTYVVLAPEHQLVQELKDNISNWEEVQKYINNLKNKSEEDRVSNDKEKTGVELKGLKAVNPVNGREVAVWIADYVLASYGTGMVMAVPAHDERDWAFAKKYNLEIIPVIKSEEGSSLKTEGPYVEHGILFNSREFDGLKSDKAIKEITKKVKGSIVTKYKMRDAVFARQRYWGEPIPLKHDKDGIITEVKEKDLPLELPKVKSYSSTGTGESPLASVKEWVKAGYETNTMPGWAGSSWYFLRYMDPKNNKEFASKKKTDYWNQVDVYVGGQEHATGHLLYSRFWTNFLYDIGSISFKEPFKNMKNQGMILGSDSRKMSKRWGNVINPDDIVSLYGADTLRVYEMFMGPFDQMLPWSTESIIGSRRFLEKVWRLADRITNTPKISNVDFSAKNSFEILLNKTIKKVTEDIENFAFNTAISTMMIFVNEADSFVSNGNKISKEDFKKFLKVLSPFAPHLAEELWSVFGEKKTITKASWPSWDESKLAEEKIKIGIQVNGKVRSEILISKDAKEADVKKIVLEDKNIENWIAGKEIKRFIYVPSRIINIVVG